MEFYAEYFFETGVLLWCILSLYSQNVNFSEEYLVNREV